MNLNEPKLVFNYIFIVYEAQIFFSKISSIPFQSFSWLVFSLKLDMKFCYLIFDWSRDCLAALKKFRVCLFRERLLLFV